MRLSIPLAAVPFLILAGCTAGPDYAGPAAANAIAPPASFARNGGTPMAAPGVANWWTVLNDPLLDRLEADALGANSDAAMVAARLRQARASLRSERANGSPSGNAQATVLHARLPGVDLGTSDSENGQGDGQQDSGSDGDENQSLTFYNLGFDASWEIDLWGGQRRSVEAARAQAEAAEASLADAQVALTAEVAQTYVNLRDRQQRIALAAQSAERQSMLLDLVHQRHSAGTASALDVEQQRDLLEQAGAARVPLTAERDAYLNALAVLTGRAPGELDAQLSPLGPVPLPPAEVAVGDPAALLQRRPDVRAAERQYAAATARIGVIEAARFPSLSLMGLVGLGGTSVGDVVDPDSLAALALPRLTWNFLDFGRSDAKVEQARGVQDEAAARYRGAVLKALQDSEDALARFGARRQTTASALRSLATARRTEALMRQRFEGGTATRLQVLDAERQRIGAEQTLSQATAAMTGDFVALQKALGLGWQDARSQPKAN